MSYIWSLGKDYAAEYKKYGEKILAENEQIMKKAGITPPVFDYDLKDKDSMTDLTVEPKKDKNKTGKDDKGQTQALTYESSPILANETLTRIKFSTGDLNTPYKKGIKIRNRNMRAASQDNTDNLKSPQHVDEFLDSMEQMDGNDNNGDIKNFLESKYSKGLSVNGGGYVYYESGKENSNESVAASFAGTYKNKNEKLSVLFGGSYEYSKDTDKTTAPDYSNTINRSGNAVLMAKLKTNQITYALGGNANIYDNNDTAVYNISFGAMHNSGVAATVNRNIQVSYEDGQKIINNKTDVKINMLTPKSADTPTAVVPDIPSPEKTQELDSLVESDKQEVDDIVDKAKKGFGFNLKMSSGDAEEYGAELTYSSLLTKPDDKNKKVSYVMFGGLSDYQRGGEGLKADIGAEGTMNFKTGNDGNISTALRIYNKRIMQHGNSPVNTFMSVLDTTVSKKKLSLTVSTGYLNSDSLEKYFFATGTVGYKMKNSSLSLIAGYQDCNIDGIKDKIFHTGVRYVMNLNNLCKKSK